MDIAEVMRALSTWKTFATLWTEPCTAFVTFVPAYIINVLTHALWGERIVGAVWAVALVCAAAAVLPREGLPTALVLLGLSPTALWLSRNWLGPDMLLDQLAIGYGALTLTPMGLLVGAGGMAWLTQNYFAARIVWCYPLLLVWNRPTYKMLLLYGGVVVGMAPAFAYAYVWHTAWPVGWLPGNLPNGVGWGWFAPNLPTWARVTESIGALVLPRYAHPGTLCHPGVQVLPWTALAILPVALWRKPKQTVAGISIALFSLLPDILNFQNSGRSHRQAMAFLPLVYCVSLVRVPMWWTALVAIECVVRWAWLCWHMNAPGENFFGGMAWP